MSEKTPCKNPRSVIAQIAGRRAVDGAGVRLVRVLGAGTAQAFDPFLMLDAFDSENPADYIAGFPMHPHRGIETVTYLVEGEIDHQDSLGNKGRIISGGCQWMTAGGGIMHQEMPRASPRMLGLQLWVNLAAKDKMAPPKYRDVAPDTLVPIAKDGAVVRVLAGRYKDRTGAMLADYVPVTFLDVILKPGAVWTLATQPEDTVFAYVFYGDVGSGPIPGKAPQGACGGNYSACTPVQEKHAALFGPGETLTLRGGASEARLAVIAGPPLREPIAWGGPIVMNTDEELQQAFFELETGRFIRHK